MALIRDASSDRVRSNVWLGTLKFYMNNEYIKLIAELDKTLSMVRSLWMDAKTPDEKNKWRVRLDELLDERSRLMKARDAAQAIAA